jgi:outer membrane protein assembly factor BamB
MFFHHPPARTVRGLVLILAIAVASPICLAAVPDFCFLQTSDNHLSPRPTGTPAPKAGDRAFDGLTWFCQEAVKPQVIEPLKLTTPMPAFVIDTGDMTEFGAIGQTWETLESIIKPLKMDFYMTAGNHDNTWSATVPFLRKRFGGDHYSFDKFGCHFVCIDTSSLSEPLSSIDQRTLTWLSADLRRVGRETPVFLFGHHPLSTSEFAKPFEQLRLIQQLEPYNVVLYLMGHGHGHGRERWNQIDSVMGGTTSHPVEAQGYSIVMVQDEVVKVAFRPRDPAQPVTVTIEKPLAHKNGPQLKFVKPAETRATATAISGTGVSVSIKTEDGEFGKVTATIDDNDDAAVSLERKSGGRYDGMLNTTGLVPGMHFILATAEVAKDKYNRAEEFLFAPQGGPVASRAQLGAGFKARPLPIGEDIIVATTAGQIQRVTFAASARKPQTQLLFDAGVEILHALALANGNLYFSAAEKGVHSLTTDGKLNWACDVGAPVYGTPAVDDARVYVADMEGNVHAIARDTGKIVWSKQCSGYAVEMPVLLHKGVLYFGSWENQVYAVRANDGSLVWKQPGPAGHREKPMYKSRYYAAADCAPVAIGDRLFMTDRAYVLGSYKLDTGEFLGEIATDVAAIGLTQDEKGFYARGLSKGLTRYDGSGKPVWSVAELPMGRFPVAPTEVNGRVAVCSNRGTMTLHDAADGKELLKYQATPDLYVMAPTAIDKNGNVCVAGMDGSVTLISAPK